MSIGMALRPYQLLCAICSLGREGTPSDEASHALLSAVANDPDLPITLQCNVGEIFAYQDPGHAGDTPQSAEFNLRRDLEILHKLNLFPGATLPARILFNRVLSCIDDLTGICEYPTTTSEAWVGCANASDDYLRGRARGIEAIIAPRDDDELAREKAESLAAMEAADTVRVRPHILLCSVCQYGSGTRPPFPEDNLPEVVARMLKDPGLRITLAPHADWMMCAPCPYRAPACDGCVNNRGVGGLSNQMRDLRVLQALGLQFGATLPAQELYRRLLEAIPGTLAICGLEHGDPSVWFTGCGAATADSEAYATGRALLLKALSS